MTAIKKHSSKPINPEWYAPIKPRDKQWEAHAAACAHIRDQIQLKKNKPDHVMEPAFIYASVGFGKTILLAMIAKQAQMVAESRGKSQLKIIVMARTGDLIDQNAEKMWEIGARNSIYSASLKIKSLKYPVICGTEGTLFRSLHTQLGAVLEEDGHVIKPAFKCDILLIDEAYQVNYDEPDCQYMQFIGEMQARNPNLIIIGYGGSLYRGTQPIIGQFWKHLIYSCSMWEAIEIGYCTPLLFGFGQGETEYKGLEDINPTGLDGTDDLSKEVMDRQNKIITEQKEVTHNILREVSEISKPRNCVLITCAGKKHIKQIADVLREIEGDCCEYTELVQEGAPDPVRYAIVTEATKALERKEIKRLCNIGNIKYVLQVGAWVVGVNIPMFDTIVILRKIGSRTLLEQLVGRGERWLEHWQTDMGFVKINNLVLDYAGTFEAMGEFFDDQFIQTAQAAKAKKEEADTIVCGRERCGAINSAHARRCLGKDMAPAAIGRLAPDPRGRVIGGILFVKEPDGRCGSFWGSPKICPKCTTPNDKVARSCRRCDFMLIDPNANLTNKHYTDDDWQTVVSGRVILSKDKKKIIAQWQLESGVVAKEIYDPSAKEPWKRATWVKFFGDHMPRAYAIARGINNFTPAVSLGGHLAMFNVPQKITHRVNEKGFDIIHRKQFFSGREVKVG